MRNSKTAGKFEVGLWRPKDDAPGICLISRSLPFEPLTVDFDVPCKSASLLGKMDGVRELILRLRTEIEIGDGWACREFDDIIG